MDINNLYDQIELQLPSTRVKRRLRIVPGNKKTGFFDISCQSQVSPTKYLPSIAEERETRVFGRPLAKGDKARDVI